MIQLSEELQEYLGIARDDAEEGEPNLCSDFFVLLLQHCANFLHDCNEDFLVSSYADFIDGKSIVFATRKECCETNALTLVSLENKSEDWKN